MKKYFILFLSLCMMSIASICSAGILEDPVAVLPFGVKSEVSPGISLRETERASGIVFEEMQDICQNMCDREDLIKPIEEMRLQHSGLFDQATIKEFGHLTGAKYIVIGNFTGFSRDGNNVLVHIAIKVVEVETGRIVVGGRGDGKSSDIYTAVEKAAVNAVKGEKGIMAKMGYKVKK